MTKYQKYVLVAVLVAIFIAVLFPPFQWVGTITRNLGYGFIFDPPKLLGLDGHAGSVNVPMLLAEFPPHAQGHAQGQVLNSEFYATSARNHSRLKA